MKEGSTTEGGTCLKKNLSQVELYIRVENGPYGIEFHLGNVRGEHLDQTTSAEKGHSVIPGKGGDFLPLFIGREIKPGRRL